MTELSKIKSTNKRLWLELFLETGDEQQAVRAAYPDCGKNSDDPEKCIRVRASQLKSELSPVIYEMLRTELQMGAPDMLKIIRSLAREGQSESVKLQAAKDWLDRTGLLPDKDKSGPAINIVINRDDTNLSTDGQTLTINA